MPLDTISALRFYEFSEEADAGHGYLITLMDGARTSLRLRMFGFTDRPLAEALLAAHKRGVDCWLIEDHLQACGAPAKAIIAFLVAGGFPPEHICITTDTHGGYMHEKCLLVDDAADIPDGQFPDVETARAAGYPVVATGSTNWSHSAFYEQSNHLLILPGKAFAALCRRQFDELFTYGRQHHPAYQPQAPAA